METLLAVCWIGLTLVVGALARSKRRNVFGWVLPSLLFSPVVGLIAVALAAPCRGGLAS